MPEGSLAAPPARYDRGMKDYASYSYWLETCGDDLTPRAALDGSIDVDVAILGAGYSGLWTAYYLQAREPSLRIAIVEKEIAGFGASGRNGSWCTSHFPASYGAIAEHHGREVAVALYRAMAGAVDEVGRIAAAEGMDIHFVRGGAMTVARGPQQLPAVRDAHAEFAGLGLGDRVELLTKAQTNARVEIAGAEGAVFYKDAANIHPGRLVRGLARAVERRGAKIYEQTEVTNFTTGANPALRTTRGDLRARTIVLCGEAYLTRLRKLHRSLIPVYSLMTLTEPLSAADWAEIGWKNRECIDSARLTIEYIAKTADGRILFGGRGAPYHFGSRIEDGFDRHAPTIEMFQKNVRAWFPRLKDVRFSRAWGGPLGAARDFMPTMMYDPVAGIASARGYVGNGVATTNLAGRVLADLITGRKNEITTLPCVNHRSPNWEPEPFRYFGVSYIQRAFWHIDQKAERTGVAPSGRSLAERLTRH
jgi:glycine/D-amino acid oxidase-like deaminating enzyme